MVKNANVDISGGSEGKNYMKNEARKEANARKKEVKKAHMERIRNDLDLDALVHHSYRIAQRDADQNSDDEDGNGVI